MTPFVCTIHIGLAFRVAQPARADDLSFSAEMHGDPLVKRIERALEILAGEFFHIGMDPPVELIHVFKSLVLQVRRHLLATDATGTHGDNGLMFERLELMHDERQVARS